MIQGIQSRAGHNKTTGHGAAVYSVPSGFGEQDVELTGAGSDSARLARCAGPSATIRLGPAASFAEAGRQVAERFTLNRNQGIALRVICRQLDRIRREEPGAAQLCLFVGGEGGTGKSRVIEAVAELFENKGISHRLLLTATSGTAAARINGVTIHSACGLQRRATGGVQ
jgi:hypothetical protein